MGRMYSTQVNAVTVTAAQDFFEVLAATGKPIKIHGWHVGQYSDAGDAAAELISVGTVRGAGSVTSGSGGSSPSVHPIDDDDAAFGGTIEANNTTRMVVGSGTLESLESYGINVQGPYTHWYTPETRPKIKPGDRWTLALLAAPADSLTMNLALWLEEG